MAYSLVGSDGACTPAGGTQNTRTPTRSSRLLRSAACSLALALVACDDESGTDKPDAMLDAGGNTDGDAAVDTGVDAGGDAEGDTDVDAGADAAPSTRSVTIDFEALVGGAPFGCDKSYDGLGSSQATAVFNDFRIYLHDVRLIDAAGQAQPVALEQNGVSQLEDAVLLDFEDGTANCSDKGTRETNHKVVGEVAQGDYVGIAFKVGLPPELNHSDTAAMPSPLDLQTLTWGWNAGRVFTTIDLRNTPASGEPGASFPLHVGSTRCTGNALGGEPVTCMRPNVAAIELTGFDLETSKITVDPAAVLSAVAIDGPGGGCMSTVGDPECEALYPKLGVDPTTGASSGATQTLFAVAPR